MATRLLEDAPLVSSTAEPTRFTVPVSTPDAGYRARPRLARLATDLAKAAAAACSPSRWKEPPVFFFDTRRQAEYEVAHPPVPRGDPHAELSARVAVEVRALSDSAEVRQVARGVAGLRVAAEALAPVCAAAKDLADLLAVPDDELVTVLHPATRTGFRVLLRGVADAGQLHVLLADAIRESLPGVVPVPGRFVIAARDADPTGTAGVPMVMESRFQMYVARALRPDGTLPTGLGGSDHWLWPHTQLAAIPRSDGERVVLLGPPALPITWEVSRRFPALAAEVRVVDTLNAFRVAERLSKLTGAPVAPTVPRLEPVAALARVA